MWYGDPAHEVVHEPAEQIRVLNDLVELRALGDPPVEDAARDRLWCLDRIPVEPLLKPLGVGQVAAVIQGDPAPVEQLRCARSCSAGRNRADGLCRVRGDETAANLEVRLTNASTDRTIRAYHLST
jgi:hypothetical protein